MKGVFLRSNLVFLLSIHWKPIHCNENSFTAIKLSFFLLSVHLSPIHCNENSFTEIYLSFFYTQFTGILFIASVIVFYCNRTHLTGIFEIDNFVEAMHRGKNVLSIEQCSAASSQTIY